MAIMIGVTPQGFRDIVIVAKDHQEGRDLVSAFEKIEPCIMSFEDAVNERLREQDPEDESQPLHSRSFVEKGGEA
jgi:hypothetical protein